MCEGIQGQEHLTLGELLTQGVNNIHGLPLVGFDML